MAILICGLILFGLINGSKTVEVEPEPEPEPIPEPVCEVVSHNKVYLAIDESYTLDDTGYVSNDNSVAKVVNNKVVGVGVGQTTIVKDCWFKF